VKDSIDSPFPCCASPASQREVRVQAYLGPTGDGFDVETTMKTGLRALFLHFGSLHSNIPDHD
jgi:hypothetical protein